MTWGGDNYRTNPMRCRIRCQPFADYVAILGSSGLHEEPDCLKPGAWPIGILKKRRGTGLSQTTAIQLVSARTEEIQSAYETS